MTTTDTAIIEHPAHAAPHVEAALDAAVRLARIANQHTPYTEHAEESTGLMCRECAYLDPCPTRRMTFINTDPAGAWLTTGR